MLSTFSRAPKRAAASAGLSAACAAAAAGAAAKAAEMSNDLIILALPQAKPIHSRNGACDAQPPDRRGRQACHVRQCRNMDSPIVAALNHAMQALCKQKERFSTSMSHRAGVARRFSGPAA